MYIQFFHPSYAIALDYLLIQDDFKQTFSKILLKLFEKDEAIAQITMIITANFDKLPDDIRNLLFKLYERAVGYSALNIDTEITVPTSRENADYLALKLSASNAAVLAAAIANNYNELPENIRSLLFKLFKNDWIAANFITSIATEHKDKLYDDMMNFLVELIEKDEALGQVADAIRHNFDKIPEDIRIKILLRLSEQEDIAWEVAHIVGDNLDKLPEDIKTKLLLKLSERNNAFGAVAMIVEKNFDKFPDDIKTKLLFKLSEAKNVTGAIASIIEKNFDKLSEDARNLLLLKFSEKEIFHNYITNIIAKNFDKFSDDVIQKMLEKMQKTLQEIIGIIYTKKYYLSKEKESRLISMYTAKAKVVNLDGDYYYCKLCDTWHRYRCDAASLGNKHIAHIDEEKMNIQIAKYYFCGFCNKWHTDAKKDHLKYRLQIRQCTNLKSAPPIEPHGALSSTHSHHTPSSILGFFDGVTGIRKNESGNMPEIINVAEVKDITEEFKESSNLNDYKLCIDLNGNLIESSIKESAIDKRRRLKSTAELKFNQKQYAEAELLFLQAYTITDEYLFSWNDIPGKDTDKFLEIIRSMFGIDRIKISKIEKIDDGKILIIVTDRNNFSLSFNNDKTKAILKIDDGRMHEFIAKKENEKLNIYENIVYYASENENLCKRIAETKYKLEKYIEAIEYWEKAIYISENFLRSVNASETDIKYSNQYIEKNIFRTYRKLIRLYKKQGKNDYAENIIQQFLNKYPNQSNEVLPKLRSQKDKEESFLIDSIDNSVSLKLIKKIKIKSKAKHCIVKFIDNQLLYRFGIQKAYTLIKISNITDTDWDTHYEMEKALSNFEIVSYSEYLTFSSNFIAIWSNAVESDVFKIRVFNNAGEFLWDYDVKNISQRWQMVAISISDTGLILYAVKNTVKDAAYLIDKDKKELLTWECPKEAVKEDEDMEDSDKIYSDNDFSIYAKVTVDPFNDIRALEISRDSRYIFLGCYSGDVFCLNLEKQVIWHHKINSHQINKIISSNDGENLVIKSEDGYIYFIENGEILNKYKLTNRWILGEYHNTKQQFFISDGKEFSIFDKSGTLLSKIIFKNDVNWFDISEKLNAIAIASSDGIDIYSI